MKEMNYGSKRKKEVLDTGTCFGLFYWILNLGTYPTAYVKIPESHKYWLKDYSDIDIEVHGGLTYSKDYLNISENQKIEGWFIGWDYAHFGDYVGYEEHVPSRYRTGGKKWTTEEIQKEVYDVCYQLKNIED